LWAHIKTEDWALVSESGNMSDWPQRLWTFDKPYQHLGGSGGAGGAVTRAGWGGGTARRADSGARSTALLAASRRTSASSWATRRSRRSIASRSSVTESRRDR